MTDKLAAEVVNIVYKVANATWKDHAAYSGGGALLGGLGGMLLSRGGGIDPTSAILTGAAAGGLGGLGLSTNRDAIKPVTDALFKKDKMNNPLTSAVGVGALGLLGKGTYDYATLDGFKVDPKLINSKAPAFNESLRQSLAGDKYRDEFNKTHDKATNKLRSLGEDIERMPGNLGTTRKPAPNPDKVFLQAILNEDLPAAKRRLQQEITSGNIPRNSDIANRAREILRAKEITDQLVPETAVDDSLRKIFRHYEGELKKNKSIKSVRALLARLTGNTEQYKLHQLLSDANHIPSATSSQGIRTDINALRENLLQKATNARATRMARLGRFGLGAGMVGGGAAIAENAIRGMLS